MYNVEVKKVNSNTKTELYTIYGNEADRTAATIALKDRMAGGSLYITTDKADVSKFYKWDEELQDWGDF